MDIDCPDCNGCDCDCPDFDGPDCGDCGCCPCAETKAGRTRLANFCCWVLTLSVVFGLITAGIALVTPATPEIPKHGKIIDSKWEFHFSGVNGTTIVENTETKTRVHLQGRLGKPGDEINYTADQILKRK